MQKLRLFPLKPNIKLVLKTVCSQQNLSIGYALYFSPTATICLLCRGFAQQSFSPDPKQLVQDVGISSFCFPHPTPRKQFFKNPLKYYLKTCWSERFICLPFQKILQTRQCYLKCKVKISLSNFERMTADKNNGRKILYITL